MSIYVVDAGVAAKWFTEEEHAEESLRVLSGENSLHAPDFFWLEMDSVVHKWVRRGVIGKKEGEKVRAAMRQLPIRKHPFEMLQDSAYVIASHTGQSVYDCLYVALAAVLEGRMVTADRRLYHAVRWEPFKKNIVWIGDVSRVLASTLL